MRSFAAVIRSSWACRTRRPLLFICLQSQNRKTKRKRWRKSTIQRTKSHLRHAQTQHGTLASMAYLFLHCSFASSQNMYSREPGASLTGCPSTRIVNDKYIIMFFSIQCDSLINTPFFIFVVVFDVPMCNIVYLVCFVRIYLKIDSQRVFRWIFSAISFRGVGAFFYRAMARKCWLMLSKHLIVVHTFWIFK